MVEDKLGLALGIPVQSTNTDVVLVTQVANPSNTDVQNDYAFARQNLYDVLTKGISALGEMTDIAKQSQHPRAYEVLSGLIKTLGETNERLMNLQKDKLELDELESGDEGGSIHVANAIFVGTTSELLDMAKANKKKLANG